jgi:diguanylate cyclase (GGDEF)-like protein
LQLSLYEAFLTDIHSDAAVSNAVKTFAVFRKSDGKWYNESGVEESADAVIANLDATIARKRWHSSGDPETFFYIQSVEAVLVAMFASPPRNATQNHFSEEITRVLNASQNAFRATHDSKTGLHNAEAFEQTLIETLGEAVVGSQTKGVIAADPSQSPRTVTVLMFDIDHFKQVNDAFGHSYGDVVLEIVALRARRCAADQARNLGYRVAPTVARTGGEEFSVLIAGHLSSDEIEAFAEAMRLSICATHLPNDDEWGALGTRNHGLTPPHTSDRKVTISLGLSSTSLVGRRNARSVASKLKLEADAALYRAKAGGRNATRRFSEILARYGTVLEHHPEGNVVAIDLGSDVNARVGQEFLVRHPEFTGERPFVVKDGRTTRRLGLYPKVECGRVMVFEVQRELSFCRVVDNTLRVPFPVGSRLEAIPLGTITHLLDNPTDGKTDIADVAAWSKRVAEEGEPGESLHVAVVGLANSSALVEARGTGFVNRALFDLYGVLRERFSGSRNVVQVEATQFAVLETDADADAFLSRVTESLEYASLKGGGVAEFRAGVYSSDAIMDHGDESSRSNLSRSNAPDFARYALSIAATGGEQIERFSVQTGARVLINWYQTQKYREGVVDYLKLRELGIVDVGLENVGSLLAMEAPAPKEALEASDRALELDSVEPILSANRGMIEFRFGNRVEAHKYFSVAREKFIAEESEIPRVYKPAMALSAYEASTSSGESLSLDQLLGLIEDGLANTKSSELLQELNAAKHLLIMAKRLEAPK